MMVKTPRNISFEHVFLTDIISGDLYQGSNSISRETTIQKFPQHPTIVLLCVVERAEGLLREK